MALKRFCSAEPEVGTGREGTRAIPLLRKVPLRCLRSYASDIRMDPFCRGIYLFLLCMHDADRRNLNAGITLFSRDINEHEGRMLRSLCFQVSMFRS